MKTIFVRLLKLPQRGDELRLVHTHADRGGASEAACPIGLQHFWRQRKETVDDNGKPVYEDTNGRETWNKQVDPDLPPDVYIKLTEDESRAAVMAALGKIIGDGWGDLFHCRVRGDELVITVTDDKIVFYPMLNGTSTDGARYVEIE